MKALTILAIIYEQYADKFDEQFNVKKSLLISCKYIGHNLRILVLLYIR